MLLQSIKFSIPGKTFLCGEYAAIFGGPSLVIATHPNFTFTACPGDGQHAFHEQSPAGLYIKKNQDFFKRLNLSFSTNGSQGSGFGGSTAEFLGCYLLKTYWSEFLKKQKVSLLSQREGASAFALAAWKEYQSLFSQQKNKPSGADVIAQALGGLTIFSSGQIEVLQWPFLTKDILLFKTDHKVATHEHLQSASVESQSVAMLQDISKEIVDALKKSDWIRFVLEQKNLSAELQKRQWCLPQTSEVVDSLLSLPGVEWARGCGALGADVIAVFVDKNKFTMTKHKNLVFSSSLSENISSGIVMEVA